jgi:hypothetical protein
MWTLLAVAAAVLIAFGLLARLREVRARKAFETSLTGSGAEQFRSVRMVAPWRNFVLPLNTDGKNRIRIYGPKSDGSYRVEFRNRV